MDEFGVLSSRLKKLSRQPVIPVPVSAKAAVQLKKEIHKWQGLTIKSLKTLGERSATGMDSEYGVYVVAVDPLEGVRSNLKANDVILKVNGSSTNNLKEFDEVLKSCKKGDKLELEVFRNQKINIISMTLL